MGRELGRVASLKNTPLPASHTQKDQERVQGTRGNVEDEAKTQIAKIGMVVSLVIIQTM